MDVEEIYDPVSPGAIRVLITGFGPFSRYPDNPSWLAVKPLHNAVLYTHPESHRTPYNDQTLPMVTATTATTPLTAPSSSSLMPMSTMPLTTPPMALTPMTATLTAPIIPAPTMPFIRSSPIIRTTPMSRRLPPPSPPRVPAPASSSEDVEMLSPPQQIHITTLRVPVTYSAVRSIVSGLHARPPILPYNPDEPEDASPPLPPNGFDFILHVGVAGRGSLRLEKLAHKLGYRMKDADGQYAPAVHVPKGPPGPEEQERFERERMLRTFMENAAAQQGGVQPVRERGEGHVEDHHQTLRGFGQGYENYSDELSTDVDLARLIYHLKENGIEYVYSSMDAGHYLCDYLFYSSLVEAKRAVAKQEKEKGTPPKTIPVLAMHCGPVDQPLPTADVTAAIKKIVIWVCGRPNTPPPPPASTPGPSGLDPGKKEEGFIRKPGRW